MATLQEIENGRLANRAKVKIAVGDYALTLDPIYMLFNVARSDGKPVPKALQGKWKEVQSFRKAAERVHGYDYSVEGLKDRDRLLAEAAMNAGVDPSSLKLGEG